MFSREGGGGKKNDLFEKIYTGTINEKLINKPYLNNILIDYLPKLNLGGHIIVHIMYYSHLF